jgi:hypothetical protein
MFVLKYNMWEIFNNVNKGGLNKRFYSRFIEVTFYTWYRPNKMLKCILDKDIWNNVQNFNINVFDWRKSKKKW